MEREREKDYSLASSKIDNRRVRVLGKGTEWAEAVNSGRQVDLDERKEVRP